MITWSNDINLDRICDGLNKYIANYDMKDYYIFGLQQADRPHVRINPKCPDSLKNLFLKSGYTVEEGITERYCRDCDANHSEHDCHCEDGCEYCDPNVIGIGLRKDVRGDVDAAKKLIKTIIFALEDKLIIDRTSKLTLGRRVRKTITKVKDKKVKKPSEGVEGVVAFINNVTPVPSRDERAVVLPDYLSDHYFPDPEEDEDDWNPRR